jgi:trigger factor
MQLTISHNSATRKSAEIVFPPQIVETAFVDAIARIGPQVKLHGFRPGKTPRNVLVSKYEKEIAREVAEKLIEEHFWDAISSTGLHPISRPALESANLIEGTEGKIKVQFDIAPQVNLPEYKGTSLVKKKHRVDDAAVDRRLGAMRDRSAKLIAVEGSAAPGHIVYFDMKYKPQGMKPKFYEGQEVELKAGRPLDDEIVGMRAGGIKKFTIQAPADDPNRSIAGKQISCEVMLSSIEEVAYPEINDEFAKDMGDFENLQSLKAQVIKDLEEESEGEAIARLQSDILEKLLDESTFEVPNSMVNLQLDDYCREFMEVMANRGISHKRINWRAYRQRRLVDAERAVRSGYLLQALGNTEDIQVAEEEVDQEIRSWMEETKSTESFDAVKASLEKRGATTELRGRVRTAKIFDRLLESADITEEVFDTEAYDNLLEVERRREEGVVQARFDAGGLVGGNFEEQEGGAPEAIVPAEEDFAARLAPKETNKEDAQGGHEQDEAPPAKRGRKKAAPEAEDVSPAEEAPPPPTKRSAKKAAPEVEDAPPAEEAPSPSTKRSAKKAAPAPEPEEQPADEEKPKRGRKKAAAEAEEPPAPPVEEKPKRGRPKKSESEK